MERQQTIAKPVSIAGKGLFTGQPVAVTFRPAEADHGVVFARVDLDGARIPASIANVSKQPRHTVLEQGQASVATCEHCLSALAALQIDNVLIELDAAELPALDGSARPYLDVLNDAEIDPCDMPRKRLVITEPIMAQLNGAMLAALPCDEPTLQIVFDMDYGSDSFLGRQIRSFSFANGEYADQIAPARTFLLESEAHQLQAGGVGTHLTAEDVLVIAEHGPLGGNTFRFDDEPVRHKIIDLIGDLYLLGMQIQGRVIAYKSGHALNHALVRQLRDHHMQRQGKSLVTAPAVLDIRKLSRILPHRYPMLLVDRVIEIEADSRIRGIKNVTMNEPFFQGHYPGTPIMPGVLIVEAMAQLSGVLIGQNLEHTGKLAVLLSLDKVRLRRPVTPGDQLVLEAEKIRLRSRIAQMRCRAYVDDELAAEAEIKFMLLDDEL
jgi:UDP-3-O-[3-hydroxymyristoyl] N-acetylglucosamine deacetylase/3-hydroxyacyl-[acyl-carrier-protein] dehydratase